MSQLKIELRPHVAKVEETPIGRLTTEFDQWILMVEDPQTKRMIQYGYVPKKEGSHISLIRKVHPQFAEAIKSAVEAKLGEARSEIGQVSGFVEKDDSDE